MSSGIVAASGLVVIVTAVAASTWALAATDCVTTAAAGLVTTAPAKLSTTRVGVTVKPATSSASRHWTQVRPAQLGMVTTVVVGPPGSSVPFVPGGRFGSLEPPEQ